jgi:hypothetical protein
VIAGAACIGCSIALGCGGAVAGGALAPALSTLAAAIPLVWVFAPDRRPTCRSRPCSGARAHHAMP